MTTIKAACYSCGDVVLGVADLEVHGCVAGSRSWYSFCCPACSSLVTRSASAATVRALSAAGCRVVPWPPPEGTSRGPAISEADLAAFSAQLHDETAARAHMTGLATFGPDESAR